jgi:hypothetical protein
MHRYNTSTTAPVDIVNCLVLLLLSTLPIVTLLDLESALAHVFLSDKNASLLATANQLKTELELIDYNLNHSDNNLALKHVADAIEIQNRSNNTSFSISYLEDLRQSIESIGVDSEKTDSLSRINEAIDNASRFLDNKIASEIDSRDLRNSTIQSLAIANMTDEILREYAIAYGIEPIIATSGSMGNMMNMSSTMDSSIYSPPGSMDMEDNRIPSASGIANISNYQNAQELASKALELFRDDLKPLELPDTTKSYLTADIRSTSVSDLEDGLSLLLSLIDDKKPYSDIMQIIHGPVHTSLFLAYDLKMMGE